MGLTGPKSGDYRGQDERIETDKGIDSSAEEERKVAPAVMGLGCLGTTGGLTCGRQAGVGDLGNVADAMSDHPDVHMALFFFSSQVVCQRREFQKII